MNEIYLWIVTAVTAAVAVSTVVRLWTDRRRLWREDLRDEDRAFAWRIVIFLVFPLMTLVDLRSTIVASQFLGGYVKDWSYGFFWYYAVPGGMPNADATVLVLFAGVIVQLSLAMSLLPSLCFRPHPFLATLIGYVVSFIFGVNLIVDPLLAVVGLGGSRWHLAWQTSTIEQKLILASIYLCASCLFILFMTNHRTRLWFADLSRPTASEELRDTLLQVKAEPDNPHLLCQLGILYERAGLRRLGKAQLRKLRSLYPRSVYASFLEAVLAYRKRNYSQARRAFLTTSDFPQLDPKLKASLLAAAGCSAFAEGDMEGALNFSERALEFDDGSLVARMVKVDVFLRTGKKEQAGEEIITALRRGLDIDIEDKIPLDTEKALQRLARMQAVEKKSAAQPALRL